MGRPKLTLKLGDRTVIRRLLDAFDLPGITATVIVARMRDEALQAEVAQSHAHLVQPEIDPPDMRTSVEHALRFLREHFAPSDKDGWLLCPADHPVLDVEVLKELIAQWQESAASIVVPTFQGRRGHPTFFRWSLVPEITAIPPDSGLNVLLKNHAREVSEIAIDDDCILTDLDTPDDFDRLRRRFADGNSDQS